MAAFFYTATKQTEKLWLNNMTTNLPAKTASAKVVPAAAAVEMVVVGSGRRIGWGGGCNCCGAMTPPIHSQTDNVQYLAMLLEHTSEFEGATLPIYLYLFPHTRDYETHFV